MKVLVVDLQPRARLIKAPLWTPVYAASVAGAVRAHGHDVRIVERGRLEAQSGTGRDELRQAFRECVERFRPDAALFDVRPDVLTDLRDLGEVVRHAAPDARILAGGRHPSMVPANTLETNPFLDGVIAGEPEQAAIDVADGLPLREIGSVTHRDGDRVVVNPRRAPVSDLDQLPFPALDLLDMEYHTSRTPRAIPCIPLRTVTVETSRGCDGGCLFCSEGRLHGPPHRWHSPGYLVEMIGRLETDYRINGLYFADETFAHNRTRVAELCEALAESGLAQRLQWSAQVRTDAVDAEILALMKRAGCVQIEFGVETGSQRILDRMAKGTTVEGNVEALRRTREAGIRALTYIMFALPDETEDDIRATGDFIDRADPNLVRLIRFIPFPGTPATDELIGRGMIDPAFWVDQRRRGDPQGGDTRNFTAMSDATLERVGRGLYCRRVLPRFRRDFIRHHTPIDYFTTFNIPVLLQFLVLKAFPSMGKRRPGAS